ncbi:hypothetical protein OE88DRAFT_1658324 [Heliocybe sulcata]|uniref:Uncharacterized protein n=1 Tax=Heliocybe sulcata TaxID=5364 RepID=A0A5C3N264_9AGAM|nr:hypothetical protein OE88DRAFT_1658324 [Heliocybe sulcata]
MVCNAAETLWRRNEAILTRRKEDAPSHGELHSTQPLFLLLTAAAPHFGIDETKETDNDGSCILWTVYGIFYGAEPLFPALVALLIEPCFSEAARRLLLENRQPDTHRLS